MRPIYLDYNATTPLDPRVSEEISRLLREVYGNPSSSHSLGKEARKVIDSARESVAGLIGASSDEIIFTGGGTEASNQAIKAPLLAGFQGFFGRFARRGHLIISAIEHPATCQPAHFLKSLGFELTVVGVDGTGMVCPDDVKKAIQKNTRLISIMHSNNEVGTLQPIREIGTIARERGILFHTDAAQSAGKKALDVRELTVDMMTLAGHKMYAPKGIGVLFKRKEIKLPPLIHGAGHEKEMRAGTENVPYIGGLGLACQLAQEGLAEEGPRLMDLRDSLWHFLKSRLGEKVVLNGHPTRRLPNTLNASFLGCKGWEILEKTPLVAASTGSACHEENVTLSPVLCAMHADRSRSEGALRLTVGRFSTREEIAQAAEALIQTVTS
ncbi:MAG: cysteine desulfurase [Gemmataceae bacterium]|nr:cysteine desulfurase [Gemmataceae bacterium]